MKRVVKAWAVGFRSSPGGPLRPYTFTGGHSACAVFYKRREAFAFVRFAQSRGLTRWKDALVVYRCDLPADENGKPAPRKRKGGAK